MSASGNGNIAVRQEKNQLEREETRSSERFSSPAVDILETEEGLTIIADLPGVDRELLNIGVDNGILTIHGDIGSGLKGNEMYREFSVGSYYRQFQLPEMIDPEKAKAELRDGVLTLHLAKAEHAKPRRIEIKGLQ